jgi:diguanylate cyclase (GGDEF)-like protein/PAS domain S-box-containing protein
MIFDNAAFGIVYVSGAHLQRCNDRFADMLGFESGKLIGRFVREIFVGESPYAEFAAAAESGLRREGSHVGEVQLKRRDGSLFWVRATGKRVGWDQGGGAIWVVEDITERRLAQEALLRAHDELETRVAARTAELETANVQLQSEIFERMQAEKRIWHIAHHDALTGLPNRALLQDRLDQALIAAERNRNHVAVLFLDLDRFKNVNDSLGHDVGDALLQIVADRLVAVVRDIDTVCRLGGDEFVIILGAVNGPDDAVLICERIIAALAQPVDAMGHALRASTSIGIAFYPDDASDAPTLMKSADAAMYAAKSRGRNNFQFFSADLNAEALRFFQLEQKLRHAVGNRELVLYYQPQVDTSAHRVCALEALVRWQSPKAGLVPPAEFIPVAEETGLIVELGEWVLREACRQLRDWHAAGWPRVPVAVNLSARQFQQRDLVARIRNILDETGLSPDMLELEITESCLMHSVDDALAQVRALAEMGIRLVIDDFGTGYSSLSYLKRFPVSQLKIDRSFVRDLCTDREDAAIVSSIIGLARTLDLDVVAADVKRYTLMLKVKGKNEVEFDAEFTVAPDAVIEIGGIPAGLGDVAPNTAVRVEFTADKRALARVDSDGEAGELAGTVKAVDVSNKAVTLTVVTVGLRGERAVELSYAVTSDCTVRLAGKDVKLDDLKPDMPVRCQFALDRRTVNGIWAGPPQAKEGDK